jgi:hypothetical protein
MLLIMKSIRIFIALVSCACLLSSCVTGGFDDNEQLDELNDGLKKTPKIESVMVNGTEVERNTQSRRIVEAHIGDVLDFDVDLVSGTGAQLVELEFSRVYYYGEDFQEAAKPVDPDTDGFYEISGKSYNFTYSYTVPEVDDDGFDFSGGYVIQVYFRARNSLGNYGYRAVEIHIVD